MTTRILIADDEFGLADVVAEILTETGYEVAIAINGQLALTSIREKRPDLVLLDLMMPILDGMDVLRAMRADSDLAAVPVVMMTSLPEALPDDLPAQYQAVLRKPFTEEKLYATLQKVLKQKALPSDSGADS